MSRNPHSSANAIGEVLTNIRSVFESAHQIILEELDRKEMEIAHTVQPLYMRKQHLVEDAHFISAQILVIERCLADPTAWTDAMLNAEHQALVEEVIENSVAAYTSYISEREYVFRDDQLIDIRESRAQEVLHYRREFLGHAERVYGRYQFQITSDLNALKETLSSSLKLHQEEYESANAEYTEMMMGLLRSKMQLEGELIGRQLWLREQEEKLKLKGEAIKPVEKLCIENKADEIKAELKKFRFSSTASYLKSSAPNALHYACCFASLEVINILLQAGVAVDVPDIIDPDHVPTHYYPMHYVAMRDNVDGATCQALESIKQCGGKFNQVDERDRGASYGRTPLHTAALFGNLSAVRWLIQEAKTMLSPEGALAFINQCETGPTQKNTALHNATYAGHFEIIKILLEEGADCRLLNFTQNTALMELLCGMASLDGKSLIMQLFYQKGFPFIESDLEKLSHCIRPHFDEKILPVLLKIKSDHPDLMETLNLQPYLFIAPAAEAETLDISIPVGGSALFQPTPASTTDTQSSVQQNQTR